MLVTLIAPLLLLANADDTTSTVSDTIAHTAATIVVQADPFQAKSGSLGPSTGVSTVDELMKLGGITLVQRAQMAGEATVRGLRGGQITTTIDGMKVHAACVDNMDPATAYVELDNLRTLELTQGAGDLRYGANLGGSLNFVSQMPLYGPLSGDVEAGYELNGLAQRARVDINGSAGDVAARVGYVHRLAHDIKAGNGVPLRGSGLLKHNANLAINWRIDAVSSITAHVIYDRASDIGYPALLMDTRLAEAVIGTMHWRKRWSSSAAASVRLYANTVTHTMDDFSRSEAQVRSRAFMPNMRMPMDGTSTTAGVIGDVAFTTTTSVLSFTVDAWALNAAASMRMVPLDPAVAPLTLTNVGNAIVQNIGLNISWETTAGAFLTFRSTARLDVNDRHLQDAEARSVLQGYVGDVVERVTRTAPSVHASVHWQLQEELTLSVALARTVRLPTHLETFGFFIYEPQADIVTIGNPGLRTEASVSADVRLDYSSDHIRFALGVYAQRVSDFIAAPASGVASSDGLDLRLYRNIGLAMLSGFDGSCTYVFSDQLFGAVSMRYTYAELSASKEPLPLIPPLSFAIRAVIGDAALWAETLVRAALQQQRASTMLLRENSTASWAVLDISLGLRIGYGVTAKLVLSNALDAAYHEHTSIRDLPSRGRSLGVTMRYSW